MKNRLALFELCMVRLILYIVRLICFFFFFIFYEFNRKFLIWLYLVRGFIVSANFIKPYKTLDFKILYLYQSRLCWLYIVSIVGVVKNNLTSTLFLFIFFNVFHLFLMAKTGCFLCLLRTVEICYFVDISIFLLYVLFSCNCFFFYVSITYNFF